MGAMKRTRRAGRIVKLKNDDTFLTKRPVETDREGVTILNGHLLYCTETDKFLTTADGQIGGDLCWRDQSAYFVGNEMGYAEPEEFRRVVKFVSVDKGVKSVVVPATTYRQKLRAFHEGVYVESKFSQAYPYIRFLAEQQEAEKLNEVGLIFVDPAHDKGDITVIGSVHLDTTSNEISVLVSSGKWVIMDGVQHE